MTTGKILYQGTLTTTPNTTLYTVPANTRCYVTSIVTVNVGGSGRTFNITIKASGGTARNYSAKNQALAAGAKAQVLNDPQEMRLGPGDIIAGDADANDDVQITIMGLEVV